LINYFKSYSSLGDDRFLCHPVGTAVIITIASSTINFPRTENTS